MLHDQAFLSTSPAIDRQIFGLSPSRKSPQQRWKSCGILSRKIREYFWKRLSIFVDELHENGVSMGRYGRYAFPEWGLFVEVIRTKSTRVLWAVLTCSCRMLTQSSVIDHQSERTSWLKALRQNQGMHANVIRLSISTSFHSKVHASTDMFFHPVLLK